jgi:hypothetical protein
MIVLFIAYIIFPPIKPHAMCLILPWFVDLDQSVVNELNTTKNSYKCVAKDTLSSDMGQWISLPSALLMHDAMNNASSHNVDLDQFHMDASYLVTLSCFM